MQSSMQKALVVFVKKIWFAVLHTGRVSRSGDVRQQCRIYGNSWHHSWFRRQNIYCSGQHTNCLHRKIFFSHLFLSFHRLWNVLWTNKREQIDRNMLMFASFLFPVYLIMQHLQSGILFLPPITHSKPINVQNQLTTHLFQFAFNKP